MGKIYTAKSFSATLSFTDDTHSAFFLFPEFSSTSSPLEAAPRMSADTLFLSLIIARINPFEVLASYSHVPYLKHDTCTSIMLHFVDKIPNRDLEDERLMQS